MKRKMMLGVVLLTVLTNAFADITVSDVEAFSGYPWKEVVIGYTIAGANGNCFFLQAKDLESGKSYVAARTNVSGADFTPGRHMLKWNMTADGIRIRSNRVEFSLKVWDLRDYCVIDLEEGTLTQHFPVEYIDMKVQSTDNEYRHPKLCLKLIWPGKFKMQNQYDVTITKPFYMGIYPMTQGQYELVMGENPSSGLGRNERKGSGFPVQNVSYSMIRGNLQGARWPVNDLVDASSFLGVLRAKTGLALDLPTEAQWEYACRAGTTTTYSFGDTVISSMVYDKWFNYYTYDEYGVVGVGRCRPNAWGLYDMHGLVWEWCLDWYGNICEAVDPRGTSSGSGRVLRGGDWNSDASKCTSSYRCGCDPAARNASYFPSEELRSFRLSMTIEE